MSSNNSGPERRSLLGSLRTKLGRKNSKSSTKSAENQSPTKSTRGASELAAPSSGIGRSRSPSPNPLSNRSPATRRPAPGTNTLAVASVNEPPPAYTPSPTNTSAPSFPNQSTRPGVPGASSSNVTAAITSSARENPYSFLGTFDTVLLIDDSGSMAGRSWREVAQALATIAPIVTQHDSDGIDLYFMNHKSRDNGNPSDGIAPTGYRSIKRAETIAQIFSDVRPNGGTPTGTRVHHILKPYVAKCEQDIKDGKDTKPLNLIVLTDGMPSDDVESVIIAIAKKLDKIEAPPFQVGVQFFQVGNEREAREALEQLDDELSNMVDGGVRDIVDTVTWNGGDSSSEGGVGLTGDGILKVCLGSVIRRLDRKNSR